MIEDKIKMNRKTQILKEIKSLANEYKSLNEVGPSIIKFDVQEKILADIWNNELKKSRKTVLKKIIPVLKKLIKGKFIENEYTRKWVNSPVKDVKDIRLNKAKGYGIHWSAKAKIEFMDGSIEELQYQLTPYKT